MNKVTLTTEEFKSITDRINQLEKGITMVRPKRVKEHTAKVAIVDKQPVISWDSVKDDGTANGENLKISLNLLNGETREIKYLDFVRSIEKVVVKILEMETKEKVETEFLRGGGGIVNKVDQKTDRMTGEEIELSVTYVENMAKVEILEGELVSLQFELNANYLNP